jgi:hypothetical protein
VTVLPFYKTEDKRGIRGNEARRGCAETEIRHCICKRRQLRLCARPGTPGNSELIFLPGKIHHHRAAMMIVTKGKNIRAHFLLFLLLFLLFCCSCYSRCIFLLFLLLLMLRLSTVSDQSLSRKNTAVETSYGIGPACCIAFVFCCTVMFATQINRTKQITSNFKRPQGQWTTVGHIQKRKIPGLSQ